MASTLTASQDMARFMRRRNLTSIPKDQQALLAGENSWLIEPRKTSHGSGLVPGHVLRTVKETYDFRNAKTKISPTSSQNIARNDDAPDVSTHDRADEQDHLSQRSSPPRSNRRIASSQESQISWSSSPSRSALQHSSPPKSQTHDDSSKASPPKASTPKGSPPEAPTIGAASPKDPMLAHPPRPTPQLRAAATFDFPSSGEADDVEMESPQAQPQHDVPASSSAPLELPSTGVTSSATTNPPPCGQAEGSIIDGTSEEINQSSKESLVEAQRPSRRMKPIIFSDDSPGATKPLTAQLATPQMPTVRPFPEEARRSSSFSNAIIPAAHSHVPMQKSIPASPSGDIPHVGTGRQLPAGEANPGFGQQVAATRHDPHPQVTSIAIRHSNGQGAFNPWANPDRQAPASNGGHGFFPQHPPFLHSRQLLSHVHGHGPGSVAMPHHSTDPYQSFISTYPDYVTHHAGDVWNFVRACVCVEILQMDRSLREYLYDDFIRAFSGEYLAYVNGMAPGQTSLGVIEWYNSISGPILFNRMCVRKDNLQVILESYPEEVARARVIMRCCGEENQGGAKEFKAAPSPRPAAQYRNVGGLDNLRENQALVLPIIRAAQATPPTKPSDRVRAASPDLGSDTVKPPGPARRQLSQPPKPPHLAPKPVSHPRKPSSLPSMPNATLSKPSSPRPSIPASTPGQKPPMPSQYLDRLLSNARLEQKTRKRSAEEQERLREHFRKRRMIGSSVRSSGSRV